MIKKLIDRLLGKGKGATSASRTKAKRVEVSREQHGIDVSLVDERAIKVVKTLKDAGFTAYIVGGAVRDLLLGLRPKDFDVATDATPEQVKQQFRRAFIIGRRFRIVHVVFGRGREHEVIEVSTFRALVEASAAEQVEGNEKTSKNEIGNKSHVVDSSGRVLRDNVWGSQDDDAARRDFTVNAMYYDPLAEVVVDYFNGLADGKKRVLRMIGDAATRYREDPVRVLRAVRFAAKLGFAFEPKTLAPMREAAQLLRNVPASRMFDEMIKLLQTGHAVRSLAELRKHGLVGGSKEERGIFPILDAVVDAEGKQPERDRFIQLALEDTDRRVGEDKPVAPSFLLACLLWHEVLQRWQKNKARGDAPFPALQDAIDAVFDARVGDISGRGKLGADMREIWSMQPRFERRVGNAPFSLVEQPRFRAGFDFLRLRAAVGEVDEALARWWEAFSSTEDEAERRDMIDEARKTEGRGAKPASGGRTHRVERTRVASTDAPDDDAPQSTSDEGSAPAKKRRRRRRKPAGAGPAPQGE